MTVYVDDMEAKFGRLVMCHMIADSESELHAMADTIGVARKWYQDDHYDIAKTKRALAVENGAKEITQRELGMIVIARRRAARGILTNTYWAGTACSARVVKVIVGAAADPKFWFARLEGQERIVVEVTTSKGQVIYIDNENGQGIQRVLNRASTMKFYQLAVARVVEPVKLLGV